MVLTPEEKDTFRHQILTSPTLSAEDKRLYLLEFGMLSPETSPDFLPPVNVQTFPNGAGSIIQAWILSNQ